MLLRSGVYKAMYCHLLGTDGFASRSLTDPWYSRLPVADVLLSLPMPTDPAFQLR